MLRGCIVGTLACQKDSYLRTIDAQVVSCVKASAPSQAHQARSSKKSAISNLVRNSDSLGSSDLWQVEFTDSVLFPEGGGQPTDHGTILPLTDAQSELIRITSIQRHGLHCIYNSPKPLPPGTLVRQVVDFDRRWDHMQQHTGQHLLSAIMDKYDNLKTLGWGMGAEDNANYVDLPRKPSEEEMQKIQDECNRAIRENLSVALEYPSDADIAKLPDDYDDNKGVIRVIKIGDLDSNTCCGTHLCQTSHIGLILLGSTQTVHSKNCRLSFTAGDRAIKLATTSIASLRAIAKSVSSGPTSSELLASVSKLKGTVANLRKKETRLLQDIAKYEVDQARADLESGKNAWVYRADQGTDFMNKVIAMVQIDADSDRDTMLVAATGEEKAAGQIVIVGNGDRVDELAAKIKDLGIQVKGGRRGDRWQGKVIEWKKRELESLKTLVDS